MSDNLLAIIVNYRSAHLTLACLRSLIPERKQVPGLRAVVVENDSGDEGALREGLAHPDFEGWVSLEISDRNGGFAWGNNMGIRYGYRDAPPEFFVLINPDTEVRAGALGALIEFMKANPKVGIAGSSFENEDGSDWKIAFKFPTIFSELENGMNLGIFSKLLKKHIVAQEMGDGPAKIDWVAGACMMIRREVIEDIGGLDERYFLYFEETDFCMAARNAGWACWYVPKSRVMHIAGQSTGVTVRDAKPKRMPGYWFDSRRRYFVKNFGHVYAGVTDVAFLCAYSFGRTKRILQRRSAEIDPPHFFRDFVAHSVLRKKNWPLPAPQKFKPDQR